jgi:hypothetical protein
MKLYPLMSVAGLALLVASAASAASFSPASGGIAVLGAPTVTTTSASFSSPTSIFGTTGSLTAATGVGTVSGTLNFSDTPGTIMPETLANFMTFADTSGGTFNFDVSSVQTISYVNTPKTTGIVLYLLGTAEDSTLGLTAAPTSETITINSTGGSVFSASASIQAPPAGAVPEPASWAMMLLGFGVAGGLVRRARKPNVNLLSAH